MNIIYYNSCVSLESSRTTEDRPNEEDLVIFKILNPIMTAVAVEICFKKIFHTESWTINVFIW